LRQRIHDEVDRWSDEQFAAVITGYTRTEYMAKVLNASSEDQLDMSFLRLFQAADPAHPRVYVISNGGTRQASLDIIGSHNANAPCIVLYLHASSDNHFEAVSWKPSRGGTPLTTSFSRSHEVIVSLEKWNRPTPPPTRKRRRPGLDEGEVIDLVQDERSNGEASYELTNQPPSS
jgi:hypothetical protein